MNKFAKATEKTLIENAGINQSSAKRKLEDFL